MQRRLVKRSIIGDYARDRHARAPLLARRQIDAGAIGMTCATLAEAEALVSNGITDILISRELAGDRIACTGFATGRSKKF
jgi:hypothetical protein